MPLVGGNTQPAQQAQSEPPAQNSGAPAQQPPAQQNSAPAAPEPSEAPIAQPPDDFAQEIMDVFNKRQAAGQVGEPEGTGEGAEGEGAEGSEGITEEPPAEEPPAAETGAEGTTTEGTATGGQGTEGQEGQEGRPSETPPEQPPAAPSGYTFQYFDGQQTQTATISDEEVQSALALSAWAQSLPEETRGAMGAIETGQAVAIPRADYDQYVAWRNQQQAQQRDADLQNYDDPEAAAEIKRLRDQIAQLGGEIPGQVPGVNGNANGAVPGVNGQQAPGQPQQVPQGQYPQQAPQQYPQQQQLNAQQQAEMNAIAAQTQTAQAQYATEHGMSEDQVRNLMQQAVDAEIIPYLMNRDMKINPVNNQVIATPDIGKVTREALDFARSRVMNNGDYGGVNGAVNQETTGTPPPPEDPVNGKKARAASLASAKGGAAPPAPNQVRQLSEEDRIKAMASEIQASMAN